jgi:hypothetical protein
MPKRLSLILFLVIGMVFLAVLPALADSVDTAWVRRYNGPGDTLDMANAIAIDQLGNVYVTGGSYGIETGMDYTTMKYYPNGDTAWVRRYNGPVNGQDAAYAIVVDDSNNVYVTGASDGQEGFFITPDYATIKYYPNGDVAWVKRYNGSAGATDRAHAIAIDNSGNVYVTGSSSQSIIPDYATIKYYPNGDTAWVRRYNGPGNWWDETRAIAVDGSGNVYVTGASDSWGESGLQSDYATIKYDASGSQLWAARYDGPLNFGDGATAIAVDDSGNIYVAGYSWSLIGNDYVTIKYYPNGDTAWVRRYNGPANGDDLAYAIAVDGSDNVYVTGYSDSTGTYQDYATIKYDSNGNELWVRRYNGPPGNGSDEATAIAIDSSDNVYVTGWSGGGETLFDYATIKYYPDGDTAWVRRYNGPINGDDRASAIVVDGSGNVYVTGKSYGSGTDFDYATIKYSKIPTDVKNETAGREKPFEFALFQNYPNPFNQSTKIEFTLVKSGFVKLNIYDILGRKVKTLISEHLSAGYKSVLWDGKNDSEKEVSSGIYFYQLKVRGFSDTKKLVFLK